MPTQVHYRACNLCEAMCGVRIDVEHGVVTSIRGDEDDPFSQGYICPKAVALKDLHEDPDRLRHPVRRSPSGWQRISWDEALDEAAERLVTIQRDHGRDAVGAYIGNPTVHNTGALLFGPHLLRALRSKNRYSATSVDQLPHMLVAYWMLGHQLLLPIPDVDRTKYFLILGANPLASNGSLMTAPGMRRRIAAIRARGGKVVVVDPRRTETAEQADEHVFVRPGTDALLLLALLNVALEGGARPGRLAAFTDGFDALGRAVREFSPERVAKHTLVTAETIRRLANELRAAESAVAYGRVGTSTQSFGTLCQWAICALNIVTGNFDRPGGAMFTTPAIDPLSLPEGAGLSRGSFGRWKSRVRGLPEFGGELPVAALADEILTEGTNRLRGMITIAGNPVLSTPNGGHLDKALSSLDFMVSIDPYINETTRHAHLILPPPSPLERPHYDLIFHALAVRNTARHAPALFQAPEGSLHDWQILLGLTRRIERLRDGKSITRELKWAALERLGVEGLLDLGLRAGPYGISLRAMRRGLDLKTLEKSVHGVDLGPLVPRLPERLGHKDKRIRLLPPEILSDLDRLRSAFPEAPAEIIEGELLLIGRRHLRDNNSWLHNVERLVRGPKRCTLMIHPDDAGARDLADGDVAHVASRVGEVSVPVEVTRDVMPGVVCLPHGYGHARSGVKLAVAVQHAGVSLNDLTDEQALDELSGNAVLSGVPVRVRREAAAAE